jgi:hypothetical protein
MEIQSLESPPRLHLSIWITRQTLYNYRQRLSDDTGLLQLVSEKKIIQDKQWASEIPSMLQAGIDFLKRSAQLADATDPDVIHSIAGAVKIVSEVQAMRDVIDQRIRQSNTNNDLAKS